MLINVVARRALACIVLLYSYCPAYADVDQCERAIRDYKEASSELADYVNRYVRCLNNTDGSDDCSSEFSRLKRAQSDFEDAVSELGWKCR